MPRLLIHANVHGIPLKSQFPPWRENVRLVLTVWRARQRRRRELCRLLNMGPEVIADIGMTMEEAEAEAGLPFWKAPKPC